jgi:hypothetical protein
VRKTHVPRGTCSSGRLCSSTMGFLSDDLIVKVKPRNFCRV